MVKWFRPIIKTPDEYPQIINLRNKKYGFRTKLVSLFTRGKGSLIIICIELIMIITLSFSDKYAFVIIF